MAFCFAKFNIAVKEITNAVEYNVDNVAVSVVQSSVSVGVLYAAWTLIFDEIFENLCYAKLEIPIIEY